MIKASLSRIKKYVNEKGINELDVSEKLSCLNKSEFLEYLSTFDCASDFNYRTVNRESDSLVVNVKTSIGYFNPFEIKDGELKDLINEQINFINESGVYHQMEYDCLKEATDIDGEMTVAGKGGGYWGFSEINPNSAFEAKPEKELKNKLVELLYSRFSDSEYENQDDFEYDMNEFITYEINSLDDIHEINDFVNINPEFEQKMYTFAKDCKNIVKYYEDYENIAEDFLSEVHPDKLAEYKKEVFLAKIDSLDLRSGFVIHNLEINNKKYEISINTSLDEEKPSVNVKILVNGKPLAENSRAKFNGVLLKDYANINVENSKDDFDKFLDVVKLKRFINGVKLIQGQELDKTTEQRKLFSIKDISTPNNIDWTVSANKSYSIDNKNNLKINYETIAKNNITQEEFKIKDLGVLTNDLNKLKSKIMPNQISIAENLIIQINKESEIICSGNESSIKFTSNDKRIFNADQNFGSNSLNGIFKNDGFKSKDQQIIRPKVKSNDLDIG